MSAAGPGWLYKLHCIKHLPTLRQAETSWDKLNHNIPRWTIRREERSLIWWDRLLSLSLGWTYCQQGQSSGLQLWKCDSHSAIRLILNSVLTEKCPNNQIVYFNYIKFPGSQNIIVASWRQLEIHFRQPWSWYKDPPAGFNGSDTGNFADYCCYHVGRQKLSLLRPMKLPLGVFFREVLAVADVGGGVKNCRF